MAIKTLSIPKELDDFLADNPDLSPSKMLQSKIIEIKENRRLRFHEIESLKRKIVFLTERLQDSNEKLAQKELI